MQFLGIVCRLQTKAVPEKVRNTIQQYPVATAVKQLQAFGGLLGFWQTFIPHLAYLMRPLQHLTKERGSQWQWTKEQQQAFDLCKEAVVQRSKLFTPYEGQPFEMEVTLTGDTMSWGLWQQGAHAGWEPIGFWSCSLQGATANYTPLEKQLLAVVWALLPQ